jgi:hypothetical protein
MSLSSHRGGLFIHRKMYNKEREASKNSCLIGFSALVAVEAVLVAAPFAPKEKCETNSFRHTALLWRKFSN